MNLENITIEQLSELETAIDAERARRAGSGLAIRTDAGEEVRDPPPGGALLTMYFCTDRSESIDWYPTVDAAMAALSRLARAHGRKVDGHFVDLTVPGCYQSYARVDAWPGRVAR